MNDKVIEVRPVDSSKQGKIYAVLTDQQIADVEAYQRHRKLSTPEFTSRIVGYIAPENIRGYYCNGCGEDVTFHIDVPKIEAEVVPAGKLSQMGIKYSCASCNTELDYVRLHREEEFSRVPEELIIYDGTGNYKKPTIESIEALFGEISNEANEGNGSYDHPDYGEKFDILGRCCEKIGYVIDEERLNEVEDRRKEAFLERFVKELPQLLQRFPKDSNDYFPSSADSDDFLEFSRELSLSDDMEELLGSLFDGLPHLDAVPENCCEELSHVLNNYQSGVATSIRRINSKIEETTKQLEEAKKEEESRLDFASFLMKKLDL